jgi:uncharacterized protein (UPF0297 family)
MPSKQEIEASITAFKKSLDDRGVNVSGRLVSQLLAFDVHIPKALEAAEKVRWQPISELDLNKLVVAKEDGKEFIGRLAPPFEDGEVNWFTEVDYAGESIIARHPTEFREILPTPPEGE